MAAHNLTKSHLDIPRKNSNVTEYLNDPSEWCYRCEGAWTMVVSCSRLRRVLRLRKKECKKSAGLKDEDYLREALNSLDFMRHVVSPLIGHRYVHFGEVLTIPRDFISAMTESCRRHRPKHRLNKEIDGSCSIGVIVPDFCFVPHASPPAKNSVARNEAGNPTFSVEIKPKCGFLPISPYIDPSRAIKYSVCHYCMLQVSKVKEGKYKRRSKYCPLDLFSREPARVMFALECLVSDPQNNLRVFYDGKGIFTEELIQDAIQHGKVCCAEMYFEDTLKEIESSYKSMMAVERCEDCVTTDCHKWRDCTTADSHKREEHIMEEFEHGVSIKNRSGGYESAAKSHQDCVTKYFHHTEHICATESHKCGNVGILTRRFLSVVLEILISDSKKSKISLDQVSALTVSQRCKESKYSTSKTNVQSNLDNLQFGPGGVLECLLSMQKLDDIDVEGAYQLYKKVINHFECNLCIREKLGVDGPYTSPLWESVASLDSSTNGSSWNTSDKAFNTEASVLNCDFHDKRNLHDAVFKICQFAVAGTAKDLSVMIAFQKMASKNATMTMVETNAGEIFHYSIGLVDLEPKEFDRVLKYYKDSKNAVKNYLESIQDEEKGESLKIL